MKNMCKKNGSPAWFLSLVVLAGLMGRVHVCGTEQIDWMDMLQGASVVHEATPLGGDAWGLLGKDGGYRLMAEYPYEFVVDLGELREVSAIMMGGPIDWGMWAPDVFHIEYLGEDRIWRSLVKEEGWAAAAQPAYIKTFEHPVVLRQIRFTAESGGWHANITSDNRKEVQRMRNGRLLITQFSLYPTTRISSVLEPMLAMLGMIERKLEFIEQNHESIFPLDEEYERLRRSYQELSEGILEKEPVQYDDYQKLVTLNASLGEVEKAVADVRNRKYAQEQAKNWLVGTMHPMDRTRSDYYTGKLENSPHISSARHEYEDIQVVVIPVEDDLTGVSIELTDLVHEDGISKIGAEHITHYRGVFIHTQEPHYPVDYVGEWLDGLVPWSNGEELDIRKGRVQPFWITIYTPKDQLSGLYKGTLKVSIRNGDSFKLPVFHEVYDFQLPDEISLQNVFSIMGRVWNEYYGKNWFSRDLKYGFYEFGEFLLKRRINPTSLYAGAVKPPFEYIESFVAQGMNTFNMGLAMDPGPRNKAWFEQFIQRIKRDEVRLLEKGVKDKAFIYLVDEPFPYMYEEVVRRGRVLKETTDIPLYAAMHHTVKAYPEEFREVVDIWGPTFSVYEQNREWFQERRREGDQVWWYFVGWGLNMDQLPLKARVFPWLTWNENLDGVMQWCLNRYWHKGQAIDNWDGRSYQTHNGVGNYVYPGPDGEIYPSMRLEHMRDGMEDYEYLKLLKLLISLVEDQGIVDKEWLRKANQALNLQDLIPGVTEFVPDYSFFIERRNQIGRLIEQKNYLLISPDLQLYRFNGE